MPKKFTKKKAAPKSKLSPAEAAKLKLNQRESARAARALLKRRRAKSGQ